MNCAITKAQPRNACGLAVVRVRAKVKPVAVVSKVKNRVRALQSTGMKAARCPSTNVWPKRGFNKPNRKKFAVINLGLIQKFVDAGTLDAKATITEDLLVETGVVRRKLDGIRVLAKGEVSAKLNIEVTGASKSAIEAVEKAGGSLKVAAAGCGRIRGCERAPSPLHTSVVFQTPPNRKTVLAAFSV